MCQTLLHMGHLDFETWRLARTRLPRVSPGLPPTCGHSVRWPISAAESGTDAEPLLAFCVRVLQTDNIKVLLDIKDGNFSVVSNLLCL